MSAASVSRWRRLERGEGDARPGPLGGDQRSHGLERHGVTILEIIAGNCDATLAQMRAELEARSVRSSIGGLWRFLGRHAITLKKVGACQ